MSTVEITREAWNRTQDEISKLRRALEDECFRNGDTETFNSYSPFAGHVISSASTIRITVIVGRSLKNISSVSVTQMIGAIVGANGSLNVPSASSAGALTTDWKTASDVSVTASVVNEHVVLVTLNGTGSFYNATNNRPVVYVPANGGLTLEFGGS